MMETIHWVASVHLSSLVLVQKPKSHETTKQNTKTKTTRNRKEKEKEKEKKLKYKEGIEKCLSNNGFHP